MTKEQLLDALQRLMVETGSLACLGCGHEHNCSLQGCNILREAVAAIREQGERRWIPVTERLPETFVPVLAYIPSEVPLPTIHESYIADHGAWVRISTGERYKPYAVTHWMPLPEPLEDGTA